MKAPLFLLSVCLLGAAAVAAERGPAGTYRLVGEQDVESRLSLQADGRFRYFLIAGALDEQADGRWRSSGEAVTLATEPRPVPPRFEAGPTARTETAAMTVRVSSTEGRGVAGVDLWIGFDSGAPLEAFTRKEGWSLPADEKRIPRWIELEVPVHRVASPRFPIDLRFGNALAFTLVPNDLGKVDFDGVRVERAGKALVMHRWGGPLRYEPVRE